MEKKQLKHLIDVAAGREQADLCVTNCHVVDVFNKEVFDSDIYITEGTIASFGFPGIPTARKTVDAGGRFVVPGFIDSHVHIESSHVSPAEFARLVVPSGTTTVIADPHEIVNVCGIDGFDYMLEASEGLPLSVFLQVPSCVPSMPFEHAGAVLNAAGIEARIDHPRVLGLGEMMDFPGVCSAEDEVLDKLLTARNRGKIVDGHYLGTDESLDAYCAAGIANDHECAEGEDLRKRIRRGMYVLLRQGTVCHDLLNLLNGVDSRNADRCLMCTDDRASKALLETGSIDNNVRMAIGAGVDPVLAVCMATINAASCFGLHDRGAIAPGRRADFLLLSSLDKDFTVDEVYCAGVLTASSRNYLPDVVHACIDKVRNRMNVKDFSAKRLELRLKSPKVKVIEIIPGAVVTNVYEAVVDVDENGVWHRNKEDIVKIAVVERHLGRGTVGLGLLKGYGLQGGALATSIAHDSHNIIVAGDRDDDMALAVEELIRVGGGMTVVKGGRVLASIPHEIAGLMTDLPGEEFTRQFVSIVATARKELHVADNVAPFMTLCFMSLPVIPSLKITDMGLYDINQEAFVPLEAE